MSNNKTYACLVSYGNLSHLGSETEKHTNSSTFYDVTLSALVIVAIFSLVAVTGNALINFDGNLEEPIPPHTFLHSASWIGFH